MSKAQYLLLATFIGFYGLLFASLVLRVLASFVAARVQRLRPTLKMDSRHVKRDARRPWTAGLYRSAGKVLS